VNEDWEELNDALRDDLSEYGAPGYFQGSVYSLLWDVITWEEFYE
jgi:hypothetical protein